jgi:chromosome segregation ATPase
MKRRAPHSQEEREGPTLGPLPATPPDEYQNMCFIFKTLFRTAVIGTALTAAVVGGSAMIVGPDRVGAMADQLQNEIEQRFDAGLDEPASMARQIDEAQRQYSKRIGVLRKDLAGLREERSSLEHDQAVSERVVSMVDRDLDLLRPEVQKIQTAQADGAPRARLASVSFDGELMSYRRASAKVKDMERTRLAHAGRAADAQHNLKYLRNQEQRFETILEQLEEEKAQLDTQLVQLKTEVQSMARNQRLIKMLKSRQNTLDSMDTFEATSLDQITSLLERKRSEQEAELDELTSTVESVNYEALAKCELAAE